MFLILGVHFYYLLLSIYLQNSMNLLSIKCHLFQGRSTSDRAFKTKEKQIPIWVLRAQVGHFCCKGMDAQDQQ